LTDVVVLATPPFWFATTITFPIVVPCETLSVFPGSATKEGGE